MPKKKSNQSRKLDSWRKKVAKTTSPEELRALLGTFPDPETLLGVDRVTLARWLSGESRIPFSAAQLLRLLAGELPRRFGPWAGWRFTSDGFLHPPGWGEGLKGADITDLWSWRARALLADGLIRENERLKRDLAFHREQTKKSARLGFAVALVDVLDEVP